MWERYCRGVQAVVYVVDAADHDSLDNARAELHELLSKPSLSGAPKQPAARSACRGYHCTKQPGGNNGNLDI
jgi:hypothetical protein